MIQCFASEKDIKVMEWPLEAGSRADRELSLLTDWMGRRGLGCKARKTLIFTVVGPVFFTPQCTALGAPSEEQRRQKSHSHPSSHQGSLCSYTAWSIGMGGSVQGLAGSVRHAVSSPQRDPRCPMLISQPAAPHASFQLHQCCRVICK